MRTWWVSRGWTHDSAGTYVPQRLMAWKDLNLIQFWSSATGNVGVCYIRATSPKLVSITTVRRFVIDQVSMVADDLHLYDDCADTVDSRSCLR